MHIVNSEGVHFCLLGDKAVFLDTRRDRYFATPAHIAAALQAATDGAAVESVIGELHSLIDAKLIELTTDKARQLNVTCALPASEDWPAGARASLVTVGFALAHQIRTIFMLRRRKLAVVLRSRQEAIQPHRRGASAAAIISAHRVTNLLLSTKDRCLSKSLALYDMLRAAGHRPRLVFGVRDYPFGAHAWVELEGLAASDFADFITFYRPILVI